MAVFRRFRRFVCPFDGSHPICLDENAVLRDAGSESADGWVPEDVWSDGEIAAEREILIQIFFAGIPVDEVGVWVFWENGSDPVFFAFGVENDRLFHLAGDGELGAEDFFLAVKRDITPDTVHADFPDNRAGGEVRQHIIYEI